MFIEPESRGIGHGQKALSLLKHEMGRLGVYDPRGRIAAGLR
jgi:hypothetical protein